MTRIKITQMMTTSLVLILLPLISKADQILDMGNDKTSAVKIWWLQCNGDQADSTCLTDAELSKFKTLCSDRENKEDCKTVVDYAVAKTRLPEGQNILKKGFAAQVNNFKLFNEYKNDVDKIWNAADKVNTVYSFVVGTLPSCEKDNKQQLYFSPQLRPAVRKLKNEILKVYESLAAIPCPSSKDGFTLVAIGKVHDSSEDFEVYTMNEKKEIKFISTAVNANPFQINLNSKKLATQTHSPK